ncbi:MAG: LEA type 2 family protein [Spirochaetota bacterium]
MTQSKHARSRKTRRAIWGSLLVSGITMFGSGGCAVLEQFLVAPEAPTARVVDVRVSDLSFDSVELTADIELSNPNSFSLELARLAYAVDVRDTRPVSGRANRSISLQAEGTARTEVAVQISYADLFETVSGMADAAETAYRLEIVPGFDVPVLGPVDIPLAWEGTIPVLRLPTVRLSGISLESVSFLNAQLSVGFEISNPNAAGLSVRALDFAFGLNGYAITETTLESDDPVPAESTARRSLLVDLNFVETGAALRSIITGEDAVAYTVIGELAFALDLPFLRPMQIPFELAGTTSLR